MMEEHQYQLRYLDLLSVAHKTNILLYFREENSVEIARKIRPEVSKITKTGELKDVFRLLEKHNHSPNAQGINLLIAEVDHTTPKLLEFLHRRRVDELTRSFPILPVILLVPAELEPEMLSVIRVAPGVDVIMEHPFDAASVFEAVVHVSSRQHHVQNIYADIHKFKESRKYTYLPLFDDDIHENPENAPGVIVKENSLLSKVEEASDEDEGEEESLVSEVGSEGGEGEVVPEFLVKLRRDLQFQKTRTFTKVMEPKDRVFMDDEISQNLRKTNGENLPVSFLRRRDSLSSKGSIVDGRMKGVDRSGSTMVDMSHKNLLNDVPRPKWRVDDGHHFTSSTRPSTSGSTGAYNPELMPFINRPTPVLRPRSVAGLNKREVANCWKIIQHKTNAHSISSSPGRIPAASMDASQKGTTASAGPASCEMMSPIRRSDAAPRSVEVHNQDPERTSSPQKSSSKPPMLAIHQSFDISSGHQDRSGPLSAPASDAKGKHFFSKAGSSPSLFTDHDINSLGDDSNEPLGYIAQQAKVKKQLTTLIAKAPHDPDTKTIITLNISDRVLSFDIRDQLEAGFRFQQEEDFMNAELCYSRALAASNRLNKNLPLLMRAAVSFTEKKYFLAILDYTEAIQLLNEYGESVQDKADVAVALHNRALSYFCVGNDTSGLEDLCTALESYQPENLKIREMLLLAYRRLGKFSQATAECVRLQSYIAQAQATFASESPNRLRGTINIASHIASAQNAIALFSQDRRSHGSSTAPQVSAVESDRTSMIGKGAISVNLISVHRRQTRKTAISQDRSGMSMGLDSSSRFNRGIENPVKTIRLPVAVPDFHVKKSKSKPSSATVSGGSTSISTGSADAGRMMTLEQTKQELGFPRSIFETIFIKTSPLQDVLSLEPNMRSTSQLAIVSDKLKQVPFLYKLSEAELRDLAGCAEYRMLTTKGPLFSQDRPMEVFCILLTGQWQMRLDVAQHVVQLGNLNPLDIYGHIDLLFQKKYPSGLVEKYMKQAEVNRKRLIEEGKLQPDEDVVTTDSLPRGVCPETFMSCYVVKPTEVLLVSAEDFAHRLIPLAEKDFEERMELLLASGLFEEDLSIIDMVRMVRMSRIEAYKPGAVIVRQGETPNKLFFVLKGICKVQKRPDKAERTRARLIEMQEQTDEHDMKYSFHHKLRGLLTPAPSEYNSVASHNFATAAEAIRYNLGQEIKKLEQSQILREKSTSETDIVDVVDLKWPRVFGEASVAVPEGRPSLGTVVADTYCEVLWLHKMHLQTFRLGENFQERLRLRSVRYPSDHILVEKLQNGKEWAEYRAGVLDSVSKSKWPGHIIPSSQAMKF